MGKSVRSRLNRTARALDQLHVPQADPFADMSDLEVTAIFADSLTLPELRCIVERNREQVEAILAEQPTTNTARGGK